MNLPSSIWDGKVVAGPNGCHIWTGALNTSGYGHLTKYRKLRLAHRVIYEECWGTIPEGLMVLHKCNVRRCVNPLHLYVGTAVDNMRDRINSGYRQKLGPGAILTPEARAILDRNNVRRRIKRGNS